jgi:fatty acid/phospholipid biosynthesis enzyme
MRIAVDMNSKHSKDAPRWIGDGITHAFSYTNGKTLDVILVGQDALYKEAMKVIPKHLHKHITHQTAKHVTEYKGEIVQIARAFHDMHQQQPSHQWDSHLAWAHLLAYDQADGALTFYDTGAPLAALGACKIKPRFITSLMGVLPSPRQQHPYTVVTDAGLRMFYRTPDQVVGSAFNGIAMATWMDMPAQLMFCGRASRDDYADLELKTAHDLLTAFQDQSPIPYTIAGFGKARELSKPQKDPQREPTVYVCDAETGNHVLTVCLEMYQDTKALLEQWGEEFVHTLPRKVRGGIGYWLNKDTIHDIKQAYGQLKEYCYGMTGFYSGTMVNKRNSDTDAKGIGMGILGLLVKHETGMLAYEVQVNTQLHKAFHQFRKTPDYQRISERYSTAAMQKYGSLLEQIGDFRAAHQPTELHSTTAQNLQ